MADPKVTETADGRVFFSQPREDGETSLAFKAHGEAAALLREAGYVARLVVERVDGSAISDDGKAFVTAAVEAEALGKSAREAAASVHFARARARLATERAVASKKAG